MVTRLTEPWYGKPMAEREITNFLNEQATGVLSLSNEGRAYGIPMSFAYDEDGERATVDFGFAEGSKKREFFETTDEVCLTVYEWEGPTRDERPGERGVPPALGGRGRRGSGGEVLPGREGHRRPLR